MTDETKPDAGVCPPNEPTQAQITAAMMAYDLALPTGCPRAPLALHMPALRAAIVAALNVKES